MGEYRAGRSRIFQVRDGVESDAPDGDATGDRCQRRFPLESTIQPDDRSELAYRWRLDSWHPVLATDTLRARSGDPDGEGTTFKSTWALSLDRSVVARDDGPSDG